MSEQDVVSNENQVVLPTATITFDLEELSGLFFMANMGGLSVAKDNTKPGTLRYREIQVDYKAAFVEFKNSCSGEKFIATMNRIGDEITRITNELIEQSPEDSDETLTDDSTENTS